MSLFNFAPMATWPNTNIRVFPGFYVAPLIQANNAAAVANVYDTYVKPNAFVAGMTIKPTWGMMEPERGKYDFSMIKSAADLVAVLGDKLAVTIQYKQFDQADPTQTTVVPEWMKTAEFHGGYFASRTGDTIPKFCVPKVLAAYKQLLKALVLFLANNPAIAYITFLLETAPGQGAEDDPDFSKEELQEAYENVMQFYDSLNPKILGRVMVNFYLDLAPIFDRARAGTISIGCPDSIPFLKGYKPWHDAIRDFDGVLPTSPAIQPMNFGAMTGTYPANHPIYPGGASHPASIDDLVHYCGYGLKAKIVEVSLLPAQATATIAAMKRWYN